MAARHAVPGGFRGQKGLDMNKNTTVDNAYSLAVQRRFVEALACYREALLENLNETQRHSAYWSADALERYLTERHNPCYPLVVADSRGVSHVFDTLLSALIMNQSESYNVNGEEV